MINEAIANFKCEHSNMLNQKVCVIGDNCVDIYPKSGKSYVGGNGINSAIALKRNGIDVGYVGVVGNDEEGELVIAALEKEDIGCSRVVKLKKKTAWTKIELNKGDRVFVDESLGVQHKFDLFEEDYDYLRNFAWAHHTIFSNWPTAVSDGIESYYEKIKNQIQKLYINQVRLSVDFSEQFDRKLLTSLKNRVDLGFFSRPKLSRSELKEEFEKLYGYGFSVVVITMGARGSAAFYGRDIIYQPAIPTKMIDTLGVGDAFIGAFLSQWVRGETIKVTLEFAAGYAASTCLINGAF